MPHGVPVLQVQPVAAPSKPWWKSRTLWVNAVVLLAAAAESQLQVLQPLLPVNVYALVAFVLPLLNVLLRTVTQARLSIGAQPAAQPQQPGPTA
jgi:hypothetical protein